MKKEELIPKDEQKRIVNYIVDRVIKDDIERIINEREELVKKTENKIKQQGWYISAGKQIEQIAKLEEQLNDTFHPDDDSENEMMIIDIVNTLKDRLENKLEYYVRKEIGMFNEYTFLTKTTEEVEARIGLMSIGQFDNIVKSVVEQLNLEKIAEESISIITRKIITYKDKENV